MKLNLAIFSAASERAGRGGAWCSELLFLFLLEPFLSDASRLVHPQVRGLVCRLYVQTWPRRDGGRSDSRLARADARGCLFTGGGPDCEAWAERDGTGL